MTPDDIKFWQQRLADASPVEILSWAAERFGGRITLASALGLEAQVMIHLIARNNLDISVFTLDTGRLFNETHELIAQTEAHYDMRFNVYMPDHQEVESLVDDFGSNGFRNSLDARKQCCTIRKVNPLRRALEGKQAWITGLRKSQSVTREDLEVVSWDAAHELIKINPLLAWNEADVWSFIRENHVPYSPLFDQGFASIGCAPCTRAIKPGEDIRAGRWWWEDADQKECGIHIVDGRVVRGPQPITV